MIVEKNRNLSKLIQSLLTLLAQKPKDDTHGHGQKSYFGQNAHPYLSSIHHLELEIVSDDTKVTVKNKSWLFLFKYRIYITFMIDCKKYL